MASGFHYSCSQFLSSLQFPSLSTQVQEVARQLREPSISSADVTYVAESVSSSRPAPSHALKLFLSGCVCTEFGAVESSSWGLRRLYETGFVSTQELIPQLQTKLLSCPHPTPLISLLADLLLMDPSRPEYDLLTHQHPLAPAFSHCPDSVICVISSLLTKQNVRQLETLRMLWPCLVHLLIHPQLAHWRNSLSSTLLEVSSAASTTESVALSLIQLLLLSIVCSADDAGNILIAVVDFSLSSPKLAPLSDVISFSYNLLLHCSSHAVCSILSHKLERLFVIQPDLVFHPNTVPWLALSLLSSFLTPIATKLSDITQLIVEAYQQDSAPDATKDSISLLFLPLLSSQLSLQRIRPDLATKYSLLLRSLLSAPKRCQRGSGVIGDILPESSLLRDVGVISGGDLCLSSFISRFLSQCHLSLLSAWCEDSILLLTEVRPGSHPPPLLSCLAISLLMEFTSSHSSADVASSNGILRLLLQLISLLVCTTPTLSPPLIACLVLAMDRCPCPEVAALTLHTLSSLSTHPACVLLLLRSLLSLAQTSPLLPPLLRALASLWKRHDSVFPHLKQLIQVDTPSSPDWSLARALSILDVCQSGAAVHGEEMLPLVSDIINSRDSPLFICIGLSALTSLVEAGVFEYAHSLRLLHACVGDQPPERWEASIALRAAQLLRLSHSLLELPRDQELLVRSVQQQLSLLAHSEETVRVGAISALSETSPQQLILLEPFSLPLRSLLSLPDCLDLPADRRHRSQCGALCSHVLRMDFTPRSERDACAALSQFLSRWLEAELSCCSTVFPREHKQEAERGEAALRSAAKLLVSPLPKLTHLTEVSDLSLSPLHAASILSLGRELWDRSTTPGDLCKKYLKLFARTLLYSPNSLLTPSDINSFLVFIHTLKHFMSDVISSITLSSPLEILFPLLDSLTCSRNPQGVMWLMVGLALNVRELHSSALQDFIQSLINSLIAASSHLLPATDSYVRIPTAQSMSFSQDLSTVRDVAYLGLGVLGGVMVAHLKQNFSANTLNLVIRVWNSSQCSSHQLDFLYALTLSSVLQARDAYLLEESPSTRKLAELSKRCIQQIQEARYPSQFAYLLLTQDVTLIQSVQQESLRALTTQDPNRSFEAEAMNCSVLTCRLYSRREISLKQCDKVIGTFLTLSSRALPDSCLHSAAGVLLCHTACHGHVASQLLIPKYLSQLKTLLQETPPDQFAVISSLLFGIIALFGAFQSIFSNHAHPCPPTPSHYSLLQVAVRTLLDHIAPRIDKKQNFSRLFHLLGSIYRHFSLFSEAIRTPSSSTHLPDNIILTPLLAFIEQSLNSGNIYCEFQPKKFETIFESLSQVRNVLPSYPWVNLITCFQRNCEHDGLHSSLLRLLFRLQARATEQEHQQIRYILHHWILDPAIPKGSLREKSRKVVADNLSRLFDSTADPLALKKFLFSLLEDSDLFLNILQGSIKMLREQETEKMRTFKIIILTTSLEQMLKPPFSSHLYEPEFINTLDNCLSRLAAKDIERLILQEGDLSLSLRVRLFNHSHKFAWLKPCIPYLIGQSPLTCIPPSPLQDLLVQLSQIGTRSFEDLSQVCLEVLNIAKSMFQDRTELAPTKLNEECFLIVFNTLYVLSLISPEISHTSGMLPLTPQKILPHNTPLDSDMSSCLSNMTHALIAISEIRNDAGELHTPIMKKLYEFLLLFYQYLGSCDYSDSVLIATVFNFLIRMRHMDSVFASKPWALFGQAIYIQSKLLLK